MIYKTRSVDSATISPGKGQPPLPVLKPGSRFKLTIVESGKSGVFIVGHSSPWQLCCPRHTGDSASLHLWLKDASPARPVYLFIEPLHE